PRADARLGRRLRPDHRDGDPRCPRRRDRRPHPVHRRRADREGARRRQRRRGARRDGPALGVTRVALKGLAGRKLRGILTALAIVIGVMMISGTFILTDTIKAAFGTVFTEVYKRTDVVITG